MIKLRVVIVLFVCLINSFGQAQIITEPDIALPQDQFEALYDEFESFNPLSIKGNVASLKQINKEFISPLSDEEFIENHNYIFNNEKQIIEYSNDLGYDEYEQIEDLNLKSKATITNDTIIKQENFKYTFKKGMLVLIEEKNIEYGYLDSIVFNYKNNKLIGRTHFNSIGMYQMDEEGNINANMIVFEEFAIKFHQKITYNTSNKIKSYKEFDFNLDIASTNNITYNYNSDNNLKSYKQVSNSYYAENINTYVKPEELVLKKEHVIKDFFLITEGHFDYDSKGRIINYNIIKSNKENKSYTVTYNNTGYKILLSRNYFDALEQELIPQNLEYDYILDKHKNLVEFNEYIIQNEKKVLTRSKTLEIIYLEE